MLVQVVLLDVYGDLCSEAGCCCQMHAAALSGDGSVHLEVCALEPVVRMQHAYDVCFGAIAGAAAGVHWGRCKLHVAAMLTFWL